MGTSNNLKSNNLGIIQDHVNISVHELPRLLSLSTCMLYPFLDWTRTTRRSHYFASLCVKSFNSEICHFPRKNVEGQRKMPESFKS